MPHQCTACGHVFEDGSKEMLSGCPDCGGNKFQFRPPGSSAGDVSESPDSIDASSESSPPADTSSVAETVGRATTKVRDFVSSKPESIADDPNPDAEWPGEWKGDGNTSERVNITDTDGDDDIIDADARRAARNNDESEDAAQANARTDVVSSSELDGETSEDALETTPDCSAGTSSDATDTEANTSTDATDSTAASTNTTSDASSPLDRPSDGEIVGEPTGEEPDLTELREQLNEQFESIKIVEPGQYELNLMELYDREEYIIALQENGRYVIQVPEQWMDTDPADR